MTVLLIILAVVYVIGVLVMAGWNLAEWTTARSLAKDSLYPRFQTEHEAEAHKAARGFVQSPLWPLLAIGALVRIYADSKEA